MRVRLLCSVALCVALVFTLCRPAQGHNGVLAVAPELTNITIDGDFSDWIRPTVGTRRTDVKYTPTSTIGKYPRVHSAKPTLRFNSRSMAIRA
jgi:hypothetical protein